MDGARRLCLLAGSMEPRHFFYRVQEHVLVLRIDSSFEGINPLPVRPGYRVREQTGALHSREIMMSTIRHTSRRATDA